MKAEAVIRTIDVRVPQDRAFSVWHEQIALWWPEGHYRTGVDHARMRMEPELGGRLFERTEDGSELDWGEISVWEPPQRIVHTWLAGAGGGPPSLVEIAFSPIESDRTRVTVTHTRGKMDLERWERTNSGYAKGWAAALNAFHTHRS